MTKILAYVEIGIFNLGNTSCGFDCAYNGDDRNAYCLLFPLEGDRIFRQGYGWQRLQKCIKSEMTTKLILDNFALLKNGDL